MTFFVYILELRDGRLYVGSTSDLTRRLKDHRAGRGGRTTRIGGFKRLLYSEERANRAVAQWRERQLKGWSRAKKLALASSDKSSLHERAKRKPYCASSASLNTARDTKDKGMNGHLLPPQGHPYVTSAG